MAFIGKEPQEQYSSIAKQDITGNGGTSYTLNAAVATPEDIEVFINHVRQEPTTSYSVSDTTLTLTEALASTDDCYVVYQGRTVGTRNPPDNSVSTQKIQDNAVTGAKIPNTSITNQHLHTDMDLTGKTVKLASIISSGGTTAATIDSAGSMTTRGPVIQTGGHTHDTASSGFWRHHKVHTETVYMDLLELWAATAEKGETVSASDGGAVSYSWHYGTIVKVNSSVGSHSWESGRFHLEPGKYYIKQQYRSNSTSHGWSSFGADYSNGHNVYIVSDAAYPSYTQIGTTGHTQMPHAEQHAFTVNGDIFEITTGQNVRVRQQTQPYQNAGTTTADWPQLLVGGGRKYYITRQELIKVQ